MTPANLQDQLIRDEGLRLIPYTDTTGHITIGIGRNLSDVGITYAEAIMLLANDVARAQRSLAAACPWVSQLDAVRLAALQNMTFNLGIAGLLQFRQFLAAVQQGQWEQAAHEMLDSKWAEQVGSRAQRLAQQIETGQWI